MFVSVIVPAYKKEKTIKKDVKRIHKVMSQTRYDFEIIVVVDGFLDKTFEKASTIHKKNIKVIGYSSNKGKGYAVKYGMARAKGDFVAFIDAGMEINPNGISMILEHMQWYKADIIVGSKRHPASKVDYPFIRKIYSFGYQVLVYLLFWLKVRDTQTGLKVYRRKVLEDVLPRLIVKQYAFDVELLAVSHYLGYVRIYESPVEVDWGKDSAGTRFKGFLFLDKFVRCMLIDTFAVYYRMHVLKYYDNHSKRKWKYDPELKMNVNTGK